MAAQDGPHFIHALLQARRRPSGNQPACGLAESAEKFPLKLRDKIRTRAVRPAGSQWLPARLTKVKKWIGRTIAEARSVGSRIEVKLDDGTVCSADHMLLGTGYSVDLSKYSFLAPQLLEQVRRIDGYPALQSGFRTSLPGLHFIGARGSYIRPIALLCRGD